jgi:perosamine synthetase
VDAKRKIASRYQESLAGLPGLRLPEEAEWAFSTFWMYTLLIDEKESGIGSRELLRALAKRNIQTRPLWQPIHRSPAYSDCASSSCPNSDAIYSQGLSLPCSVGLTESAQSYVVDTIATLLGRQNRTSTVD